MMFRRKIQSARMCASGVALMLTVVPVAMSKPMTAQESEPASAVSANENTDYKKKSLSRLRKELNSAEEDFYNLFNTVNSSDEFDVKCKNEVPLGSRKKMHSCKATFLWQFEADRAAHNSGMTGSGAGSVSSAQLNQKQEQLRAEIATAVSENPELQESFAILVKAKQDYEAKQRKR